MRADEIADLERRMAQAATAEDYELAARLRDHLADLRAAAEGDTLFHRQTPGHMGLGTDQQVLRPPADWTPPKKPDLMIANRKPRRGGRR